MESPQALPSFTANCTLFGNTYKSTPRLVRGVFVYGMTDYAAARLIHPTLDLVLDMDRGMTDSYLGMMESPQALPSFVASRTLVARCRGDGLRHCAANPSYD
jgi:hypothetical protein